MEVSQNLFRSTYRRGGVHLLIVLVALGETAVHALMHPSKYRDLQDWLLSFPGMSKISRTEFIVKGFWGAAECRAQSWESTGLSQTSLGLTKGSSQHPYLGSAGALGESPGHACTSVLPHYMIKGKINTSGVEVCLLFGTRLHLIACFSVGISEVVNGLVHAVVFLAVRAAISIF